MNQEGIHATHSFELPLFETPSRRFREAIELFSHSQTVLLSNVKYWNNRLTFTFVDENNEEFSRSVKPLPNEPNEQWVSKVKEQISAFASKLNCSLSLANKDKGFKITLDISEPSDWDMAFYGNALHAIIKAKLFVTSLPVEMAVNSFFSVIDSSPHVVDKIDS